MDRLRRVMAVIAMLAAAQAAPALAQTPTQAPANTGLGVGALGGYTFTTIQTESNLFDIDTSGGSGYMFGIWFGGNRDGRVGLMGEISYLTKKNKFSEGGEDLTQTLTYIEIPVLLRVNMGSRDRNRPSFYLLVGPAFDIQIKSKLEGEDAPETPDEFYEGLDIGLMAGAGFEVFRIGIEGRYTWGMKSVLGTDAAIDAGFGDTKTNTLQIVFKVRFN